MKSPKILLMVGVMLFAASTVSYAQNKSKKKADAPKVEHCDGDCCKANSYGYYKDVFMDSASMSPLVEISLQHVFWVSQWRHLFRLHILQIN